MEIDYVGKQVITRMTATYNPDTNSWTVSHNIEQGRKKEPSSDWERTTVSAKADAPELEKAISDVTFTLMTYLNSVSGDLFNSPKKLEDGNQSKDSEA